MRAIPKVTATITAAIAATTLLTVGCSSSGSNRSVRSAPTATPSTWTAPPFRATDFPAMPRVDNPWFPLEPGARWVYSGTKDGESGRDYVEVTTATKVIAGVRCVSVRDQTYLANKLRERTTDWYAQDRTGNVWYLGEATAELTETGRVDNTEGSWTAGINGAEPGVYMPAIPAVGQSARQEYYRGQAEDHFLVLSLAAPITVPATSVHMGLLTQEWTPLEPGVLDHKYYVRGIGTVKEQSVKGPLEQFTLVSFSPGR